MNAPIVVGVDGSTRSLDAVRWASHEAVLRGRPLHLVAAIRGEPSTYGNAFTLGAPQFAAKRREGKLRLSRGRSAAQPATGGGPVVTEHLGFGHPVDILLEQSEDAAMLVVGSRGLGRWADGILGSVSTATVLHARCPVAVIRELPPADEPLRGGPVVVGVDGTEHSEPALAEAFETASLHGVELVAVHAWSDSHLSTAFRTDPDGESLDWDAIATAEHAVLAERLAGWTDRYPDVAIRRVVVHDNPAQELITESKSAQLVVVGRRGRGGFKSMLLGSTSRNLLHRALCPLLIVTHP